MDHTVTENTFMAPATYTWDGCEPIFMTSGIAYQLLPFVVTLDIETCAQIRATQDLMRRFKDASIKMERMQFFFDGVECDPQDTSPLACSLISVGADGDVWLIMRSDDGCDRVEVSLSASKLAPLASEAAVLVDVQRGATGKVMTIREGGGSYSLAMTNDDTVLGRLEAEAKSVSEEIVSRMSRLVGTNRRAIKVAALEAGSA